MAHPLIAAVAEHLRSVRDCRVAHVPAEDTGDGIHDEVCAAPEFLAAVTVPAVLRWVADQMDAQTDARELRDLADQAEQDAGGPPWTVDTLTTNPPKED